jgi:hypothetical protein
MPRTTSTITERQLGVRKRLWPDLREEELWVHTKSKGFTNVPRAMALILRIMDSLAPKNHPVSATYLELWCRQFDEKFVALNKPREMAFAGGFTGQRAERTWLDRVRILCDLGFLRAQSGPNGQYSFALLVIQAHHDRKESGLDGGLYNALVARVAEVGAKDFAEPQVRLDLPTKSRSKGAK